jgi:hypothetical protein
MMGNEKSIENRGAVLLAPIIKCKVYAVSCAGADGL